MNCNMHVFVFQASKKLFIKLKQDGGNVTCHFWCLIYADNVMS